MKRGDKNDLQYTILAVLVFVFSIGLGCLHRYRDVCGVKSYRAHGNQDVEQPHRRYFDFIDPLNIDVSTSPVLQGVKYNGDGTFTMYFDKQYDTPDVLINYFIESLTLPIYDHWVNLHPDQRNIILAEKADESLLGKRLMLDDLQLKGLCERLTSTDFTLGKKFWEKIYSSIYDKESGELGDLFVSNRIWVTPGKLGLVTDNNSVYIKEFDLDVNTEISIINRGYEKIASDKRVPNSYYTKVLQEDIIPYAREYVNNSAEFDSLRNLSRVVVLATWFKNVLSPQDVLRTVFIDKKLLSLEEEYVDKLYAEYLHEYDNKRYVHLNKEFYLDNYNTTVTQTMSFGGIEYAEYAQKVSDAVRVGRVSDMGSAFDNTYAVRFKLNPVHMGVRTETVNLGGGDKIIVIPVDGVNVEGELSKVKFGGIVPAEYGYAIECNGDLESGIEIEEYGFIGFNYEILQD